MKTVANYAFKDITEHMGGMCNVFDENHDVWNVYPHQMNNKETRRLNKELGLRGINCKIENTFKNKIK